MRIQNTENSEKENSETKQEIRTKREVNEDKTKLWHDWLQEQPSIVFLGESALKICSKITGEQTCRCLISIK